MTTLLRFSNISMTAQNPANSMKKRAEWAIPKQKGRPKRWMIGGIAAAAMLRSAIALADFQVERWELQSSPASSGQLSTGLTFLSTDTNYAPDGTTYNPTSLTKASRMIWDTQFSYGLTSDLTAFARLNWTRSGLETTTTSTSRFGLGDQALGLNYRLLKNSDGPRLYIQLQLELPAYNNADAVLDSTPFLGNQTTDITGGGFLELPMGDTSEREAAIVLGLGFTKRNKSFSNLMPYSAELRVARPRTEGLIGRVGIYGNIPLGDDPLNGLPLSSLTSIGTGGSFLTWSLSPSLASIHGVAGYQFNSQWALNGELGTTLFGKSAQKDMRFGAGITYRFGSGTRSSDRSEMTTEMDEPRASGRSGRDGFVGYNDAFEAKVIKVNDRMNLVKIDKGSTDGVAPGQIFDLFTLDKSGAADRPIARARVEGVRPSEAALRIQTYFKEVTIEDGFVAKRPLNTAK